MPEGQARADDSRGRARGNAITVLALGNLPISDAGLVHLEVLKNLEGLGLGDVGLGLGDTGLAHDTGLVTDAGLVHLKDFTKLKALDLCGT